MVKVCNNEYNNDIYNEYFKQFSYELSPFQKYAIEAIVTNKNVITTAHTGSGKTVPAIFAIKYFLSQGKKVIYTSPIKALSNQKYNEFKELTSDIGILTGDIKINPEGSLLIMTTEILCNTLYYKKNNLPSMLDFDMDFNNELACVVFDEIHYLNDPDRGRVWEESILMLPNNIQIVGLSATIDNPVGFCEWIENKCEKEVYLASTDKRIVPLTHYMYLTVNDSVQNMKHITKEEKQMIKNNTNKFYVVQDSKGQFSNDNYKKVNDTLSLLRDKNVFVKPQHVLNQLCKKLVETEDEDGKNMLPALCFVLSRKKLEEYANQITVPLLEFDSKVSYIVKKECEQIIRKLPNYQEYINLPEFTNMVKLLERGIAIHHSGCLPVLKEIVEMLYAKGYIKLLFATETFSIGVNMPTKTVIFTDINKFDGVNKRNLMSHEYTQMAGRAGRRGIDKVGHVIHLNNLFYIDSLSYKKVLSGIPQKLTSKFKLSYNLLLNLIQNDSENILSYVKKSMLNDSVLSELTLLNNKKIELQSKIGQIFLHTKQEVIDEYLQLQKSIERLNANQKKKVLRQLDEMKIDYKFLQNDLETIKRHDDRIIEMSNIDIQIENVEKYFENGVNKIIDFLNKEGFINTKKGEIASVIKEVNCLAFSKLIDGKILTKLQPEQIVGLLSCFTEIRVGDDIRKIKPDSHNEEINEILNNISNDYNYYDDGIKYNIHYDIIDETLLWCNSKSYEECFEIIKLLESKKIFLGEFSRALLKINNITNELIKVTKISNDVELENKLTQVRDLTLKFVICNQSLYL